MVSIAFVYFYIAFYVISVCVGFTHSLLANPLAQSPEQVKLDSDKWKLWKNLFEWIEFFSKFGFRSSRWLKIKTKTSLNII